MNKQIKKNITIALIIITILPVLRTSATSCVPKYIRFESTPVYTKNAGDPGSCEENYHNGTYLAKPRYGPGLTEGTSDGSVMVSRKDGDNGEWSTATSKAWLADNVGSTVTWGNSVKATGAGETTYTFAATGTIADWSEGYILPKPHTEP